MTCVHINCPTVTDRKLVRVPCPTCEKRRWMTAFYMPWYGWDHTCLKCGENWCDGEIAMRPFLRGWRIKSVAAAKARWRAAARVISQEAASAKIGEKATPETKKENE